MVERFLVSLALAERVVRQEWPLSHGVVHWTTAFCSRSGCHAKNASLPISKFIKTHSYAQQLRDGLKKLRYLYRPLQCLTASTPVLVH